MRKLVIILISASNRQQTTMNNVINNSVDHYNFCIFLSYEYGQRITGSREAKLHFFKKKQTGYANG